MSGACSSAHSVGPAPFLTHPARCRYRWGHYLGAGIIISGIFVALFPQLVIKRQGGDTVQGILFFFLSNVPTAFSGVYKEIAFKGDEGILPTPVSMPFVSLLVCFWNRTDPAWLVDLNIYYVNAYVALFQWLIGWLYFPITAMYTIHSSFSSAILTLSFTLPPIPVLVLEAYLSKKCRITLLMVVDAWLVSIRFIRDPIQTTVAVA